MTKKLFFALTAIIVSCNLQAQNQIVYDNTQNESFLVKYYQQTTNESQIISNYFISEFSKSIPKILNYTQYTFGYSQQARIIKNSGNQYEANVDLTNFAASGDVVFRGINVAPLLFPQKTDFTVKVLNQTNNVVAERFFSQVDLAANPRIATFNFTDTLASQNLKIQVENKQFFYVPANKDAFVARQAMIEDYYASDTKISQAFDFMKGINFDNIDMYSMYDVKLKDAEFIITDLKLKKFNDNLQLSKNDPIQFIPKFNDLCQQANQMRIQLNQLLSSLDHLYYNKGMEYLQANNAQMATTYFQKSIGINPYFAPAHYQIANLDYLQGNLEIAANRLMDILNKMNPDANITSLVSQLLNKIYTTHVKSGDDLVTKEKFHEALEVYAKAKEMCTTNKLVPCSEMMNKGIARAHYGIYKSFLTVAQKAIDQGSYDVAENYISQARSYQQANQQDIVSPAEANDMLKVVYLKFIDIGNRLSDSAKYESALEKLMKANSLCSSGAFPCDAALTKAQAKARNGMYNRSVADSRKALGFKDYDLAEKLITDAFTFQNNNKDVVKTKRADSVMNAVKSFRYTSFIEKGKQQLTSTNPTDAFASFQAAEKLQSEYVFQKDGSLPDLLKQALKPIIMENIGKAKYKVWANDFKGADAIIADQKKLQQQYGLTKDAELNKAIDDYKNSVFNQECINAKNQHDDYLTKAKQSMNSLKYIEAEENLVNALKAANLKPDCKINTKEADDEKSRILPAVTYQKLLLQNGEALKRGDFKQVVDGYLSAETYFKQFTLSRFNIPYVSLFDYTKSCNDNNYILFVINWYSEKKDYDNAFGLLKTLCDRRYPANYTKNIQTSLGTAVALRDHDKTPTTSGKAKVLEYTLGNKWYKYFKKAYISTWKKF